MSLWLIFPLRLLAESLTSSVSGGGDFLTANVGNLLGSILPADKIVYPAWWAYSLSLGVFFTALPFSRYMHIPTEIVLILSRHFGLHENGHRSSFTEIEINACSRCGICLDACQLSFAGGIHNVQSAYQLKAIRYNNIEPREALNCMMCGRCQQVCPVGIDILNIRQIVRNEMNGRPADRSFFEQKMPKRKETGVIYFAGCMSHQTPGIKAAMKKIFAAAGINYWFMDEEGGICCGRPMMLAGHSEQAQILKNKNKEAIESSGAHTLVTSCPICYRTFTQDYDLKIRVMHHTQYIDALVADRKLQLARLGVSAVYHDPCELSRDLRVYDEPRRLLSKASKFVRTEYEKDNTLCCGGSLANLSATSTQRSDIARQAYMQINEAHADMMITSCPMCKKVFERVSDVPVKDIAELIAESAKAQQMINSAVQKEERVPQMAG
jgi:Fe-S oxidoreductase